MKKIVRWTLVLALTAIAILLLSTCATSGSSNGGTVRSSTCPAAGTTVPFAQLVAQAARFNGCDVTTEVSFVAAGRGAMAGGYWDMTGYTEFRVVAPGQTPSAGLMGSLDSYIASLPDAAAAPVFSLAAGSRLRLRGNMAYHAGPDDMDLGIIARLFRGSVATPIQAQAGDTATNATPPATTAATPPTTTTASH